VLGFSKAASSKVSRAFKDKQVSRDKLGFKATREFRATPESKGSQEFRATRAFKV
jgi:hypothetical protein